MRKVLAIFIVQLLLCLNVKAYEENLAMSRGELADVAMDTYEYVTQEFCMPISEQVVFLDASNSQYYLRIEQAYLKGFVNGVGDGMFLPEREANICEVMVVFYRVINALDMEVKVGTNELKNSDLLKVPEWCKDAFVYLTTNGILEFENDEFDPSEIISREDVFSLSKTIKDKYFDENEHPQPIDFETFLQRMTFEAQGDGSVVLTE